jgi:hypothetical protein
MSGQTMEKGMSGQTMEKGMSGQTKEKHLLLKGMSLENFICLLGNNL